MEGNKHICFCTRPLHNKSILLHCAQCARIYVHTKLKFPDIYIYIYICMNLTYYGRVTQICVFTLQLCKTDDANLSF